MKNTFKIILLILVLISFIFPIHLVNAADNIPRITAELDPATPEVIAGKQVIVQANIKNLDDKQTTYTLSVLGFNGWADLVAISPETITVNPGDSKIINIIFNVYPQATGDKELSLTISYDADSINQEVSLTITPNQVSATNSPSNSNTNSQMVTCYYFDGTGNYCLSRTYFGTSCPDSYYGRKLFSSEYQCNTEKLCPAKETRCSDGTCQADPNKCPCPSGQMRCSDNVCKSSCVESQKINLISPKEKTADNSLLITISICFTIIIIVICLTLILIKKK